MRFNFPVAEILNRLREPLCDFIFGMIQPPPFVNNYSARDRQRELSIVWDEMTTVRGNVYFTTLGESCASILALTRHLTKNCSYFGASIIDMRLPSSDGSFSILAMSSSFSFIDC